MSWDIAFWMMLVVAVFCGLQRANEWFYRRVMQNLFWEMCQRSKVFEEEMRKIAQQMLEAERRRGGVGDEQ